MIPFFTALNIGGINSKELIIVFARAKKGRPVVVISSPNGRINSIIDCNRPLTVSNAEDRPSWIKIATLFKPSPVALSCLRANSPITFKIGAKSFKPNIMPSILALIRMIIPVAKGSRAFVTSTITFTIPPKIALRLLPSDENDFSGSITRAKTSAIVMIAVETFWPSSVKTS